MQLDSQDMELIKQTVRAAVSEATSELVTKTEFKDFRSEVLSAHQQFYPREVVDLLLKDKQDAIDQLRAAVEINRNVIGHLWENAWVKMCVVAAGIAQLVEIYGLLHR